MVPGTYQRMCSQKPKHESQSSQWLWEEQVGSKGRQLGLRDSEQALLEAVPSTRGPQEQRGVERAEGSRGMDWCGEDVVAMAMVIMTVEALEEVMGMVVVIRMIVMSVMVVIGMRAGFGGWL